ncbi:MAG: hypothetical protein KIT09_08790 [Bryobacteraceae bacterium]|nr:hypothetical protein [Bryobacteraceae bacterium]
MRRMWNEIKAHRLATALFLLYWLTAFCLDAFGWQKPENRPDMVTMVLYLHFLLPVIAGALVAWWRRNTLGRIAAGMVAGAVVLVVAVAAVLAHQFIAFDMGETGDSHERITEAPVFVMLLGLLGSLLGLIGAAGATGLGHLADRWRGKAAGPAAPLAERSVARDVGAVKADLAGVGGTIPRRLQRVAGGLALGTAAIVALGVMPALARNIAPMAPRAIPAFAVTAILNVLIGTAMLTPVAWRNAGASRVLVVTMSFVSLLLGFALLDAASVLAAGRPGRILPAVACLTGAACNLGAGILALLAAFRRHRRSCGGALPAS